MQTEIKTCQNCKQEFAIDEADQAFYSRLNIPSPTWCPKCRMLRRWLFRNERSLYRRNCAKCGQNMLSMYAPDRPYVVYCLDCYHSDAWDPLSYARAYDPSKNFLEQFKELMAVVPRGALYQDFAENSEYSNWAVYMKNAYLVFGGHHYEDCINMSSCLYVNDCADTDFSKKCETCYDSVHLRNCNRVFHSAYSEDCSDSWFLYGCRNCTNCVGCTNLRNRSYCILGEQYTKEEYAKKLAELQLSTREGNEAFRQKFAADTLRFPRKYAWSRNIQNSSGDDLEQTKDCRGCYSVSESENIRYSFFVPTGAKDAYDGDHVGLGLELTCELMSGFGDHNVAFSNRVYYSHDVRYSDDCHDSAYLFGCIGLRKKEYCILNRQYSKEEYEKLAAQIIADMKARPYTDAAGREYSYGEFFPPEMVPFSYNESVAQEYFPLSKEEALAVHYAWRDPEAKGYKITLSSEQLPTTSAEALDSITQEIVGCAHQSNCRHQCSGAFRIIPTELQFYKKIGVPLPELCPNCRHYGRLAQKNPPELYRRTCQCSSASAGVESISRTSNLTPRTYSNTAVHVHGEGECPNEFETTFPPDSPYLVYCEACYQSEVA